MSAETVHPAEESNISGLAASVAGNEDVNVATSLCGVVNAQGDAALTQSAAAAILAQGNTDVTQSAVAAIVTRTMTGEGVYNAASVSGDMSVSRSWIGVALTPRLQVSEDSRVIIGPVGALIIAVAIFGVFGILAALGYFAARRAMQWRPRVPSVSWHRMGD